MSWHDGHKHRFPYPAVHYGYYIGIQAEVHCNNHYGQKYILTKHIPGCMTGIQAEVHPPDKINSCLCTQQCWNVLLLNQSMGARNRVGRLLSYRPARLHRLAELIPWNRFLGSLKVQKLRTLDCRHVGRSTLPDKTQSWLCTAA
jgi:hypothetical protein